MALSVTSRVEDNFGILELTGSLTLGPSLKSLREGARQLLDTAKLSGMILQLSGLTTADSSGLGELTIVYTLATKRGFPVRMVNANATLHKMLQITRLDGLLPLASDIPAAKAEMKQVKN